MKFSMNNADNQMLSEYSRTIVIKGKNKKINLQIEINKNVISMYVDTEFEISTSSTFGDVDIICTNESGEDM
jgi:hypothetical protein